jgi:hypothetical protein
MHHHKEKTGWLILHVRIAQLSLHEPELPAQTFREAPADWRRRQRETDGVKHGDADPKAKKQASSDATDHQLGLNS